MKQFKGYEEAKKNAQYSGGRLPEGAYVCKILEVKYTNSEDSSKSDVIEILFDIDEGEQKGFFKTQYINSTDENKKWKGRTRIYVPLDDGSEKDTWTKNAFAKWTDSFEQSNKGYIWDWREAMWKGKIIGIVFGSTGTVIEGKEIVYTEARFPVPADTVRSGKAPVAKFKAKNGYTGSSSSASAPTVTGDEPWMQVGDDVDGLPFA